MSMVEFILRARIDESLRLLKPCRLDLLPAVHVEALGRALQITEATRQVLRGKMDLVLAERARDRQQTLLGLERKSVSRVPPKRRRGVA